RGDASGARDPRGSHRAARIHVLRAIPKIPVALVRPVQRRRARCPHDRRPGLRQHGRRRTEFPRGPRERMSLRTRFDPSFRAVVQAYQYDIVRMTLNGSDPSVNRTYEERDTFGFHVWVPENVSFSVHVYLVDHVGRADQRRNYFEYNVSARRETDSQDRTVMVFTFPFEKDKKDTVVRITRPENFTQVIPPRGTIP